MGRNKLSGSGMSCLFIPVFRGKNIEQHQSILVRNLKKEEAEISVNRVEGFCLW